MQNPVSKKFDSLLSKIKDKYKDEIPDIVETDEDDDIATRQLGNNKTKTKDLNDLSSLSEEKRKSKDDPNLT